MTRTRRLPAPHPNPPTLAPPVPPSLAIPRLPSPSLAFSQVSLPLGRERIVFAKPAPGAELPVHELRAPSLLHALPAEGLLALFAAACVEHKIELAPPRLMCTLVCIVTCILSCVRCVHGVCLAGASSTRSCSSRRTPRS